jgi:hypothetical protein
MLLPGHSVTQEASFSCDGKYRCGAGPISPSQAELTTSPNPGTEGEQRGLALPARHLGRDPVIEPGDRDVQAGDAVLVQPAQQRVVLGEPAGQGHRQVGQLARGPHPALGQARQHRPAAFPVDQRFDHRGSGLAGNVGGDRAELDAGRFQRLAQPLDLGGAGLDRLDPLCRVPDYADAGRGGLGVGGGRGGILGIIRGLSAQLLEEGE